MLRESYIPQEMKKGIIVTLHKDNKRAIWPQGQNLNNFCRGPLDNVLCKISKL